jgi:hypothetical protein
MAVVDVVQTTVKTTIDGPGRLDAVVRRVLCIPEGGATVSTAQAQRAFSFAMALSGLRCLLSYVVLPFVLPLAGVATGAAPAIGVPIALLALVFDVRGIRRFWLADNSHRWAMTALYLAVMVLVTVLLVGDLVSLAR